MPDGCGMWVPIRYISILECNKGVVWVVCIIGVISCGGSKLGEVIHDVITEGSLNCPRVLLKGIFYNICNSTSI